MKPSNILILPGWQSSGPEHWQSLWMHQHGYQWVEQHDWLQPLRGDWIARLEEVILSCDEAAVLVAHSLGCQLVAAWAAHSRNTQRVKAALLVAPGDVERADLPPALSRWSPVARQTLGFKSVLVGSQNDPYCSLARAQAFAQAWGSEFVDAGPQGHISAASGLGHWRAGQDLLAALVSLESSPSTHYNE